MPHGDSEVKKSVSQMQLFDLEPSPLNDVPPTEENKRVKKYLQGNVYQVKLDEVAINPNQPRSYFDADELCALADSIRANGILQPLLCHIDNGRIILAAGERRLRAAGMAGLTKIPVRIVTGDPLETALIENLLRSDLTAVEEAEAISTLKEKKGYRLEDLTGITGKALSTLSEILAVARLPREILEECRCRPSMPRDVLVLISRLNSPQDMLEAFDLYRQGIVKREDIAAASRKKADTKEKRLAVFSYVQGFAKRFSKLDINGMNRTDRDALRNELENLMETLTQTLVSLK